MVGGVRIDGGIGCVVVGEEFIDGLISHRVGRLATLSQAEESGGSQ